MITGRGAFFISPEGEFINVSDTRHIEVITDTPSRFGLSLEQIRNLYGKYDEKMGMEGRARREIIVEVIKKGWVHIRKETNTCWNINAYQMNETTKAHLLHWATATLNGTIGVRELNRQAPVEIHTVDDDYTCTISELSNGVVRGTSQAEQ
ncbi:MAG TPA: hypothetical protein PKZ42_08355 [Syntrophales bacterium]|nr:hypothetical protein [Syntrophales bacterium]